jgi:lipopolysaccharide transport system ATP-binding protein
MSSDGGSPQIAPGEQIGMSATKDDIAIRVQNLSKCYQIYERPHDRLKQFVLPRLRHMAGLEPKQYFREFWALRDVSFEVEKGETVGIIGRNGSGKSTLLQMICGTLNSTSGSIQTKGRVAALLELGSGFNPEFTGRENIYMNAAVLGLSNEEIDERFDDIAAFADIGQFIEQPVKIYSSGMAIRLAFSISASIDPEILIIDEALAVGDIRFQAKCFNRLNKLKECGTTILLVSHSTDQIVKHCDRGVLIDSGQLVGIGLPKDITNKYMDLLYGQPNIENLTKAPGHSFLRESTTKEPPRDVSIFSNTEDDEYSRTLGWNPNEYRWGNGDAAILDFKILNKEGRHTVQLWADGAFVVAMKVLFKRPVPNAVFGFYIKTIDGLLITGSNSSSFPDEQQQYWEIAQDYNMVEVSFNFRPRLASGEYMISLGVAEDVVGELVPLDRRYDSILVHVVNRKPYFGLVDLDSRCLIKNIAHRQLNLNG